MTGHEAKRARLREGLAAPTAMTMVGAHDALSALLIERHGFDAVWVSGLGVSTMQHALPDLNLITMTEALDAAVRVNNATTLPVVADCDNGYGGLGNVVRTLRAYEDAGIAGICVEDNVFPKRNSLFRDKVVRELIPGDEQARRIKAAKAAQVSDSFVFIARIEALIAGHGVEEACQRADAYVEAGADAILIHSRDRSLEEIRGFLGSWPGVGHVPLVAVPTLFPDYTVEQLHELGFQLIILANHPMRAAVGAMEATLDTLARERKAAAVDPDIVSVDHIFDLVDTKAAIVLEDEGGRG